MDTGFEQIDGTSPRFNLALAILAGLAAAGIGCTLWLAQQGQWRTGLSNLVPWGLRKVMAIYFIGLSAGSLVISGLSAVFGQVQYQRLARIAVYTAMLLMIAAIMMIAMDQGRIDRFFVQPFIHPNPRSLFSINPALYVSYILICVVDLWALMTDRRRLALVLATVAVAWAIAVHSATGAIIGFNARMLYESPLLPGSFVVAAITSGTALMIVLIVALFRLTARHVDDEIVVGLGRLLRAFLLVLLYVLIVENTFRLYVAAWREAGLFLLFGGSHSVVFWAGLILSGCLAPLVILFHARTQGSPRWVCFASALVLCGVLCERYVIVIPGLCYPAELFPGMRVVGVESFEGVASYAISAVEVVQVFGVLGTVGFLFLWGLRTFPLMPIEARIERPLARRGACEPAE